ncbi:MAG: Holliday junction branch migration DNA helicase RuvB [Candidatus Peregrinibacteria bacterium]|nr:Holliday junction branch migration DNA helicase RuvB [Candidatus Peregrinibacteria bacterium]
MVLKRTAPVSPVRPQAAGQDPPAFEQTLRPRRLQEYIGQARVKEHLLLHIQAANARGEPLGHTLLSGPPGLGKTTLAHIIAQERGVSIRITSGPVLEKPGDLASILTNLQEGETLFIDEIHRLRPVVEEMLYAAMEDYALDLVIGKGPTARSMRLDLKPFTLVGATTKAGSMSAPLRDRFLHTFKLGFYTPEEMEQIVHRSARILEVSLDPAAAQLLASASRATPRIGNRLLRAIRDFAQVRGEKRISQEHVRTTLASLDVDSDGLDATDRMLMRMLIERFDGGPVGLGTMAAMLAEEEETIEDVHEPYLLQQGYLQRTPKGRVVTKRAYEKLGLEIPEAAQAALL